MGRVFGCPRDDQRDSVKMTRRRFLHGLFAATAAMSSALAPRPAEPRPAAVLTDERGLPLQSEAGEVLGWS
jgi:hypothetical protein